MTDKERNMSLGDTLLYPSDKKAMEGALATDDMAEYFEQDLAEQEKSLSAGRLQARINKS